MTQQNPVPSPAARPVPSPAARLEAAADTPYNRTSGPIHGWFSLSYSNYQVIPRTLAQSMPVEWQERIVACLEELQAAYEHIEHPEVYEVQAGTEHIVNELTEQQMRQLGITYDEFDDEPPADLDPEALEAWEDEHRLAEAQYHDRDGNELDLGQRVIIPCADPIPHYQHAYIEPRPAVADAILGGGQ